MNQRQPGFISSHGHRGQTSQRRMRGGVRPPHYPSRLHPPHWSFMLAALYSMLRSRMHQSQPAPVLRLELGLVHYLLGDYDGSDTGASFARTGLMSALGGGRWSSHQRLTLLLSADRTAAGYDMGNDRAARSRITSSSAGMIDGVTRSPPGDEPT